MPPTIPSPRPRPAGLASRGPRDASRPLLRALASVLVVVVVALGVGGCDLLPQTGTEWGVALGIFGVLFVAVVFLAWKNSRKPKP